MAKRISYSRIPTATNIALTETVDGATVLYTRQSHYLRLRPVWQPLDTKKKHRDWQHSTFVQRSYKRVHQLYKEIIKQIKEAQHE
jgi:hypothetical protein